MSIAILRRARVASCGAALLLPATSAIGQRAEPMVPRALALALVGFPWGADTTTDLLVGKPAPALAVGPALPRGARYVGALVAPEFQITVITGSQPPDSLLGQVRAALEASGWRPGAQPERGGFQEPRSPEMAMLCKGDNAVTLALSQRRGEIPTVLAITGPALQVRCGATAVAGSFGGSGPLVAPLLTNPPGTHTNPARCQPRLARSESSNTGTPVTSPLTPRQLLDAYDRQLDSLGWHRVPSDGAGSVLGELWQRTDSLAAVTRVRIEVEASDSLADCRTLRMQVERRYRP